MRQKTSPIYKLRQYALQDIALKRNNQSFLSYFNQFRNIKKEF